MSKRYDAFKKVRIDPDNLVLLRKSRRALGQLTHAPSLARLVNSAIQEQCQRWLTATSNPQPKGK